MKISAACSQALPLKHLLLSFLKTFSIFMATQVSKGSNSKTEAPSAWTLPKEGISHYPRDFVKEHSAPPKLFAFWVLFSPWRTNSITIYILFRDTLRLQFRKFNCGRVVPRCLARPRLSLK